MNKKIAIILSCKSAYAYASSTLIDAYNTLFVKTCMLVLKYFHKYYKHSACPMYASKSQNDDIFVPYILTSNQLSKCLLFQTLIS